MRILAALLCFSISIVSVCLRSDTHAQNQTAASQVKQLTSVTEIVDWLNKNSFSRATIGLDFEGSESYADGSDSMQSMSLSISRLSEQLNFSPGFSVASLNGCHLTLKNDQVQILRWGTSSYDRHRMSFSKFLMEGKKGEKKLTPQTGVVVIPLDKMDYKKGKTPYRYTKDPAVEKLLGTWRTEFREKGFFRRSIFEMQITAAEDQALKSNMTAQRLFFTFADKQASEDFNVAFRRAIQICTKK